MTYLTLLEVCEGLRISRGTALRMLQDGRLKGIKTAPSKQGRWRVTEDSYREFLGLPAHDQRPATEQTEGEQPPADTITAAG